MSAFLPYGRQTIDDDDIAAVVAALKSEYLTTGPRVEAFEAALCKATGAKHAVVCNSGTAALHLAAMALGLTADDQVIVPTLTFVATANAPHFTGAEIIFADVDSNTGLMTADTFEDALARAPRAKAVFPVHLAGQMCDVAAIGALAEPRGVAVIEDASQALGAVDTVGANAGACPHSSMATFSFHPVKTIAMGEGGAVTTNDDALALACRTLRNHGLTRDPALFTPASADWTHTPDGDVNPWVYEMTTPGYNYRAPDILCALAMSQLTKLDTFITRRRALANLYDARLAALAPSVLPAGRTPAGGSAWHLYAARIDFDGCGVTRADVMARVRDHDVGSQVHYTPVHLQPYYRQRAPDLNLPGAQTYYARTLSLPLFPAMTDADVDRVANALTDALNLDANHASSAQGTA